MPQVSYAVTLAIDAMTNRNPDAHTNSVMRPFPRWGETGTPRKMIALLSRLGAP